MSDPEVIYASPGVAEGDSVVSEGKVYWVQRILTDTCKGQIVVCLAEEEFSGVQIQTIDHPTPDNQESTGYVSDGQNPEIPPGAK